ncbi:MAG TPA: hypothetical protein VGD42_16700 [Lysobacter sp.]
MSSIHRAMAAAALLGLAAIGAGCDRVAGGRDSVAAQPVQAVTVLIADLRRDDLAAYARHAVPPILHARLETAWREGRTVWPLTELPLDAQLQEFITTLAAPGSEQRLLAAYRKQFAGAHGELRSAATTLGLFASQYVNQEGDYSEAERDHYTQLIAALSRWGQQAPLGDLARARAAVPQLAAAARTTGLARPDGFRQAGMERSLERLGPFFGRLRRVLVGYGLDFDAALASLDATLAEQTGDRARVRLRYTIAGQAVDAFVLVERRDGHWYLSDLLRHAEAEAAAPVAVASGETVGP